MAEFPAPEATRVSVSPNVPVTATLLVYALFGLVAVTGALTAHLVVVWPLVSLVGVIGIIIAYVKRDEARGTWVASHLRWLIRTFWFSMLWGCVGGLVLVTLGIILIGIPIALLIWAVASIWVIYRVIKGYLLFKDNRPVP